MPVYSVGGWYDNYVESDLDAFTTLSKSNPEDRIMIGPWPHLQHSVPEGEFRQGLHGAPAARAVKWFDHWLKGKTASAQTTPLPARTAGADLRNGHRQVAR